MDAHSQALLKLFSPSTYSLSLNLEDAKPLLDAGLIEWVPPVWGVGGEYGLTEKGRAARGFPAADQGRVKGE